MTAGPSDATPDSTLPAPAGGAWLELGTIVAGKYRLEAALGAGGFGQVYVATQLGLDRRVALKVLPAAARMSAENLARFRNEANLVQRLEHPHTVRLFDHGISDEGVPFIAMELLRGESLAACIARAGSQSEERTARVGIQVLKALMEAHGASVIHRDIKPANIFLTAHAGEPLFVKLLDFGIAKELADGAPLSRRAAAAAADEIDGGLTSASHVMGTPRYMAPEQVAAGSVGPAADLFSLGLTLSEMLTGRPVVRSENAMEILAAHSTGTQVELDPEVLASALGPVLARATRADPSARFSSAEEMLRAIERLALQAPPGDVMPSEGRQAFVMAPTEATPALSRRRGPDRPAPIAWLVAAGAAALGFAAFGAFFLETPRPEPTEDRPAAEASSSASPSAAGSTVTTSEQATVIGDLRTLVPPFPAGGFEKDPRRQASLAHLERSRIRERVERAGYTVTVEKSLGPEGMFIDAAKDNCLLNVTWFEMTTAQAAADRARLMGDSSSWRSPVVSSGRRLLSIGGGDTSEAASRACVEPLLTALLTPKPAPVGE